MASLSKKEIWMGRDGSAVKNICSGRGPRFDSQLLRGSSQVSITPGSRIVLPTSYLLDTRQAYSAQIYMSKAHTYNNINKSKNVAVKHYNCLSSARVGPVW